jgi:glucokinase
VTRAPRSGEPAAILAGDVGGTKVALAIVERAGDRFRIVRRERYPTAAFDGLAAVVGRFLAAGGERPPRACFGVAGPIVDDPFTMTNLDWEIDRARLADAIGISRTVILNDLAAAAWGVDVVASDAVATIRQGEPRGPTAGLVAAGTGLGTAILTRIGDRPHVLPSEGGHQGFAPRDALEEELLAFLRARHPGHVSVERVVSGSGIEAIYDFLLQSGREAEPAWLGERLAASADRSEEISRIALAGEAAICRSTMAAFARCYGAAAGDFALASLALRGVYLGGGIAPAILPVLGSGEFLEAFRGGGRLRELLDRVPVRVVLDPDAPLLGAARYATLAGDPA